MHSQRYIFFFTRQGKQRASGWCCIYLTTRPVTRTLAAALKLIADLNSVDRVSEDWPIAAKNLALFLYRDLEDGQKPDFTPFNEF